MRGTTDNFVFVRDGFSFGAFVFGPLWLLYQRLWLALGGYLVLSIAVEATMTLLRVSGGTRIAVMAVIAVLMGLEAASLRRWTLSRQKWRPLDVVVADERKPLSGAFSIAGERCGARISIPWRSIAARRLRPEVLRTTPFRRRRCAATSSAYFLNPGSGGDGRDYRLWLW